MPGFAVEVYTGEQQKLQTLARLSLQNMASTATSSNTITVQYRDERQAMAKLVGMRAGHAQGGDMRGAMTLHYSSGRGRRGERQEQLAVRARLIEVVREALGKEKRAKGKGKGGKGWRGKGKGKSKSNQTCKCQCRCKTHDNANVMLCNAVSCQLCHMVR